MKKYLYTLIFALMPTLGISIGGLGLQLGQGFATVNSSESKEGIVTLETSEFSNPYILGGHLYIDAIPFIDLEADISFVGQQYDFNFSNSDGEDGDLGPYEFGWASTSIYFTARKSIFSLKIPILAKAKILVGTGYNQHAVTPLITMDLMEEFLGGDLNSSVDQVDEEDIIKFLKENKIDASGFHVQAGLQFKILVLDSFLFYRHTFVEDLIPDTKNYGSINLRLGYGI